MEQGLESTVPALSQGPWQPTIGRHHSAHNLLPTERRDAILAPSRAVPILVQFRPQIALP